MPIYEYKCHGCDCEFEELVSSYEAAQRIHCPQCGRAEVQRAMSVFGFASKGAGGEIAPSSSSGRNCGKCSSHACGHCH
jgi:putative FmdB family regulatory protein